MRIAMLVMLIGLIGTLAGCGYLLPGGVWSENYALAANGGRCTAPEMNDGDRQTSGRIGAHIVAKRTGTAGGAGVYTPEVQIRPEVTLTLSQKRVIDRIVLLGSNLSDLNLFWRDDQGTWHPLKSIRGEPKNRIVLYPHIETDALRIRVQPRQPLKPMGLVLRDPNQPFELQMEAAIAEIEVYSKLSSSPGD